MKQHFPMFVPQNDQRVVAVILRCTCWGTPDAPPPSHNMALCQPPPPFPRRPRATPCGGSLERGLKRPPPANPLPPPPQCWARPFAIPQPNHYGHGLGHTGQCKCVFEGAATYSLQLCACGPALPLQSFMCSCIRACRSTEVYCLAAYQQVARLDSGAVHRLLGCAY